MIGVVVAAVVLIFLMGAGSLAAGAVVSSGGRDVRTMIKETAVASGVDPALMLAICQTESNFNAGAINPGDPSYGLFQIQVFWLSSFGYNADWNLLMDPEFNAQIACQIISYFQGKGFSFPSQADIYNVGETQWRKGVRNVAYRDRVTNAYRSYSV